MSRVGRVEVSDPTGKVQEVFEDIKNNFGMIPNLFKTLALKPDILEANWKKFKGVMLQGQLPRELKEMIAVVVSRENSCKYCVDAHSAMLMMLGKSRDEIIKIIEDIESANISDEYKILLKFSRKATKESKNISDEDFIEIKDIGYKDDAIVEFLSIIDLFTSFNIFLNTLQVEIDFPGI